MINDSTCENTCRIDQEGLGKATSEKETVPQNLSSDIDEAFVQRIEKWIALADLDTLAKAREDAQQQIHSQSVPNPKAEFFIRKIDESLTAVSRLNIATPQQSEQKKGTAPVQVEAPSIIAPDKGSKSVNKVWGIVAAAAVVAAIIVALPKTGTRHSSSSHTPPTAQRQSTYTPSSTRAPAAPEQSSAPAVPKLTGDRPLTQSSARKGYVTSLGLNVRADHNNTSRIIAQAEQGASVSIVDSWQDIENEYPWYKIDDLNEWGWVYGKYVAISRTELTGMVTLKNGYLNVRSDHSKTAAPVGRVENGNRLKVIETWISKDVPYPWYQIVDNSGNTGWVSGRYFRLDGYGPNEGWKLSDEEYTKFMQNPTFADADWQMTAAWNAIKERTTGTRYQQLLKGQKDWIASRRDRMATNYYNQSGAVGESKRECYRRATLQRAAELREALKNL